MKTKQVHDKDRVHNMKIFYNWTHTGDLEVKVQTIIPFLLYVSRSLISKPNRNRGGVVYALHITPFFTIGLNWGTRKERGNNT